MNNDKSINKLEKIEEEDDQNIYTKHQNNTNKSKVRVKDILNNNTDKEHNCAIVDIKNINRNNILKEKYLLNDNSRCLKNTRIKENNCNGEYKGLRNIDNNSFFTNILLLFYHIPVFKDFFISNTYIPYINKATSTKGSFAYNLSRLFKQMSYSDNEERIIYPFDIRNFFITYIRKVISDVNEEIKDRKNTNSSNNKKEIIIQRVINNKESIFSFDFNILHSVDQLNSNVNNIMVNSSINNINNIDSSYSMNNVNSKDNAKINNVSILNNLIDSYFNNDAFGMLVLVLDLLNIELKCNKGLGISTVFNNQINNGNSGNSGNQLNNAINNINNMNNLYNNENENNKNWTYLGSNTKTNFKIDKYRVYAPNKKTNANDNNNTNTNNNTNNNNKGNLNKNQNTIKTLNLPISSNNANNLNLSEIFNVIYNPNQNLINNNINNNASNFFNTQYYNNTNTYKTNKNITKIVSLTSSINTNTINNIDSFQENSNSMTNNIIKLFSGILEETLLCVQCHNVSLHKERFCLVNIPTQKQDYTIIEIIFCYYSINKNNNTRIKVKIKSNLTVLSLRLIISQIFEIDEMSFIIASVHNFLIKRVYSTSVLMSDIDEEVLFAFQINPYIYDNMGKKRQLKLLTNNNNNNNFNNYSVTRNNERGKSVGNAELIKPMRNINQFGSSDKNNNSKSKIKTKRRKMTSTSQASINNENNSSVLNDSNQEDLFSDSEEHSYYSQYVNKQNNNKSNNYNIKTKIKSNLNRFSSPVKIRNRLNTASPQRGYNLSNRKSNNNNNSSNYNYNSELYFILSKIFRFNSSFNYFLLEEEYIDSCVDRILANTVFPYSKIKKLLVNMNLVINPSKKKDSLLLINYYKQELETNIISNSSNPNNNNNNNNNANYLTNTTQLTNLLRPSLRSFLQTAIKKNIIAINTDFNNFLPNEFIKIPIRITTFTKDIRHPSRRKLVSFQKLFYFNLQSSTKNIYMELFEYYKSIIIMENKNLNLSDNVFSNHHETLYQLGIEPIFKDSSDLIMHMTEANMIDLQLPFVIKIVNTFTRFDDDWDCCYCNSQCENCLLPYSNSIFLKDLITIRNKKIAEINLKKEIEKEEEYVCNADKDLNNNMNNILYCKDVIDIKDNDRNNMINIIDINDNKNIKPRKNTKTSIYNKSPLNNINNINSKNNDNINKDNYEEVAFKSKNNNNSNNNGNHYSKPNTKSIFNLEISNPNQENSYLFLDKQQRFVFEHHLDFELEVVFTSKYEKRLLNKLNQVVVKSNSIINNDTDNKINLNSSIQNYFQQKILKNYNCDFCHSESDVISIKEILYLPEYLFCVVERFNGDVKIKNAIKLNNLGNNRSKLIKIDSNVNINKNNNSNSNDTYGTNNLTNANANVNVNLENINKLELKIKQKYNRLVKYNLYSVICHSGNIDTGRYYFLLNDKNNWVKFDGEDKVINEFMKEYDVDNSLPTEDFYIMLFKKK